MKRIIETLRENEEKILKIVLSDTKSEVKKILVRPIKMKNAIKWQIERTIGAQVFHENVDFDEVLNLNCNDYKQILVVLTNEEITFSKTKNSYHMKRKETQVKEKTVEHNKAKNYFINEGDDCPALVDLGVFTKDNKIVKSMYDKFKQINKFIEIIDDAFKETKEKEFTILDFGCGKSYLTFLVYYYFVEIKKLKANIIGYDIKKDVVENCNKIAEKYKYENLKFYLKDVKKDELFKGKIDMVISLHACDTATDFALDFAIKNDVKNI